MVEWNKEISFGRKKNRDDEAFEEFESLLARSGVKPRTDEHLPEALRGLRIAGATQ